MWKQCTYLQELGLDRHPFPVAPDDENFYVSAHIEQVLAEIVHGIEQRKGFMVLSGDVGLGKTTMVRRILRVLAEKKIHTALVFHTSLKDVELLREINRDFGLSASDGYAGADNFGDQLRHLNDFLMGCFRRGENCAILIDDAQNLDRASLELVRMISNLETDQQKLVQVLLVGQPELMVNLSQTELRQLRSRIIIDKTVRPLTADELRNYIFFKLSLAGNQGRINVTRQALQLVYAATRGNLRRTNIMMDRCLYVICRDTARCIDARVVRIALADLRPSQPRSHRAWLTWAGAAAAMLALACGSWLAHLQIGRSAAAAVHPATIHFKVPPSAAGALASTGEGQPPSAAGVPASTPEGQPPSAAGVPASTPEGQPPSAAGVPASPLEGQPPSAAGVLASTPEGLPPAASGDKPFTVNLEILAFFEAQGVQRYAAQFERALAEGALPVLGERLYRDEGLQLVQLVSLPEHLRDRYGALQLPAGTDRAGGWILLWKPELVLQRFYYHYQGEEIRRLQKLLAEARLYRHTLDGVVGTRMMQAIIEFQTRCGLPVSGFPDAATVFLLCHQGEGAS